jgi:hypothetical protein
MALLGEYATVTALSAEAAAAPDLKRGAGGVLVVLLAGAVWMGTATAPVAQATTSTKAGCAIHTAIAVYGHDHRVCRCVTNCVTITTDYHGLPGILRDA